MQITSLWLFQTLNEYMSIMMMSMCALCSVDQNEWHSSEIKMRLGSCDAPINATLRWAQMRNADLCRWIDHQWWLAIISDHQWWVITLQKYLYILSLLCFFPDSHPHQVWHLLEKEMNKEVYEAQQRYLDISTMVHPNSLETSSKSDFLK